jgi:Zn-finger nucleic acid-binding protein
MLARTRGRGHPRSYLDGLCVVRQGYGRDMPEEMTCPQCQSTMSPRYLGDVTVHQCSSCQGIFLERADLGNLVEAENDWHRDSGPKTQPLPRITPDMAIPPTSRPVVRSYIESLFG